MPFLKNVTGKVGEMGRPDEDDSSTCNIHSS